MKPTLTVRTLSSLAKVFLTRICGEPFSRGSLLKNEEFSYQIAYVLDADACHRADFTLTLSSPLADCITLRQVGNVPSELPAYPGVDENYLQTAPGLFPDPLLPFASGTEAANGVPLEASGVAIHALWIRVCPDGQFPAGRYPVTVRFSCPELGIEEISEVTLELIDAALPPQKLLFTQWFHCDCIASHYGLEIFSESHWEWIERFLKTAARNGINMILTPVFTPPLDTLPGSERPTVQLVDVIPRPEGGWEFGFDRLQRWIRLAQSCGITHFEISHLFTQWGAAHAPKIVAVDGTHLFGWETDAAGPEYAAFLRAFVPALTAFLRREGVAGNCWFHLSDEPSLDVIEHYRRAHDILAPLVESFRSFDALSDPDFYEQGLVQTPVAAIDQIQSFLERGIRPLWGYYCCGQSRDVSNRFFSMPSARNRIIGTQIYKYQLEGFLQWGYNFYYSQGSRRVLDPWRVTDAQNAFPSGDAFSVYPGRDCVIESLRLKVFHEALQDLRAFCLLESLAGRDEVLRLLEEEIPPLTFTDYPRDEAYLPALRDKINHAIAARL